MENANRKKTEKSWLKVTISVDKADADAVRRAVQSFYCCGIQSEEDGGSRERMNAYFEGAVEVSELRRHLEIIAELLLASGGSKLVVGAVETVAEEDWLEQWRRAWQPVRVSKGLVVCPSWQTVPERPGQTVIFIYPQMAFGTGTHETTQICLKLLEKHVNPGDRVIDIGAGSGILAIAAARLGARRITAVENDEVAIENARENCRINRVLSRVRIVHGSFGPQVRGRFDLGVCNMLGHVIQPLIGDISRLLAGKALIVSGLTRRSASGVRREMRRQGWRLDRTIKDGEWLGYYAVHDGKSG